MRLKTQIVELDRIEKELVKKNRQKKRYKTIEIGGWGNKAVSTKKKTVGLTKGEGDQ